MHQRTVPYTIQIDFTPDENGTSMVFFYVAGNDGTQTYTLEVSCYLGQCPGGTIPDVSGYIILKGTPLAGTGVSLSQQTAPGPQLTRTDSNGYYQFLHIMPGVPFSVVIHGPATDDSGKRPVGDAAKNSSE